jgi:Sulfotransferase family
MNDKEQLIAQLAAAVPARPSGLIQLLRRAPNSLRWKFIIWYWLLKREATGMTHRLQSRRVLHFLHIGKTGGTAAKSALRGHEKSGSYEIILHEHEFQLKDVPLGEKVVFFVRDPISRFVSGFYGRQRQDLPRHDAPWTLGEEIAFRRFKTPNELALALSTDDQELQAAAINAIRMISHLRSPHWTWFKNEHYFLCRHSDILFIGFQETLKEDFALLKKILNLPQYVKLPEDEVASHKNPIHMDRRLDEQAIQNLKIWYARDYQFLELCGKLVAQRRSSWDKSAIDYKVPEPAKAPVPMP